MTRKKTRFKARNLSGLPIYIDKNKRAVYSSFYMKQGYVISDDDSFKYLLFSFRFFLTIVIFILSFYQFNQKLSVAFCVSLVFFSACEILFHFWFLASLQRIDDFKKPEKQKPINKLKSQSLYRLGFSFCILFLLSVLVILRLKTIADDKFNFYINVAIALFSLLMSFLFLIAFASKIREKKTHS